jgi:iron(III) transport system ATP-binding protein
MIGLTHLSRSFRTEHEAVVAMDDLTLEVESHSFFTLLGPSGCGKSTLLRCVAGLETPDFGEIVIGNNVAFSSAQGINVPANRRHIGMVFQSYAIWPHMTVFKNVAFPLEVQRKPNVRERVLNALAMVELDKLADRYASQLSGGQQQRIAFARAIVAEPDVLLLDEPLSNLDAALREQMRAELRNLQDRLRITTLYVTHDQEEALSLSDRIAIMRNGRFVEIASPEELYNKPKTVFTARFIGSANIVEGTVKGRDGPRGAAEIATPFGTVWSAAPGAATAEADVTLFIRPERIRPVVGEAGLPTDRNVYSCTVRSHLFVGDNRELELVLPGVKDGSTMRCKWAAEFRVSTGQTVRIHIDPTDVHLLADA